MKKLITLIFVPAILFMPAYAQLVFLGNTEMAKMHKSNEPVEFSHNDDDINYLRCELLSPNPALYDANKCTFPSFRLNEQAQSMAVYILREEMREGKLTEQVVARMDEEGDLEMINISLGLDFMYKLRLPLPDPMITDEFKQSLNVARRSPYPWSQAYLYGGSNGFLLVPTNLDLFSPPHYKIKYEFVIDGITYINRARYTLTYNPEQDYLNFLGSLKDAVADQKDVIEPVPGTNAYKTKAHRLELIDALGRILKSAEGPEKPLTIEEAGAYFLRAREKNGRVAGSKGVVKTR